MQKKAAKIDKLDSALAIIDPLNSIAIFSTMLATAGRLLLSHDGRFFWSPVGIMIAMIRTIIAWRRVHLDKSQKALFQQTMIDTLTTIIFSVVVIGNICATTLFSICAPAIFIAVMTAKLLFSLAMIFHSAFKISRLNKQMNNEIRSSPDNLQIKRGIDQAIKNCRKLIKENSIAFVTGIFSVVAVSFVALLAKPVMAIFGIAAGVINTVAALIDCKELLWPKKCSAKEVNKRQMSNCESSTEIEMTSTTSLSRNAKLLLQVRKFEADPLFISFETVSDSVARTELNKKSDQVARRFSENKFSFSSRFYCPKHNNETKMHPTDLKRSSTQIRS